MAGKKWTAEENALLRELYPTLDIAEAAARLQRSPMSVYIQACRLDVKKAEGHHGNAVRRARNAAP